MVSKIKANPILFITGTILLALGIILFFVNPSNIMSIVYVGVGVVLTLTGFVTFSIRGQMGDINFIFGLLYIFAGLSLIFFQNAIVSIIIAVILIVLPIIRIIKAEDKKIQFKKEVPIFLLAVLVGFVGFDKVFVYSLAAILIMVSIYLYYLVFTYKKTVLTSTKRNSVDANFTERDHKWVKKRENFFGT